MPFCAVPDAECAGSETIPANTAGGEVAVLAHATHMVSAGTGTLS